MSSQGPDCQRSGFVSVWVGTFPSVEAAETYFGIPDEVGVYLPPEVFLKDLGLEELRAENLEVNFEQLAPRRLRRLLADATFAASFLDQAVEAASRQGIEAAQGVALLYDFDYQAKPGWQRTAGPLTFLGSFPFPGGSATEQVGPVQDPRFTIREITDNVL
jgi:hypothetical protein